MKTSSTLLYDFYFNYTHDHICIINEKGLIQLVNHSLKNLLSLGDEKIKKTKIMDYIDKDRKKIFIKKLQNVIENKDIIETLDCSLVLPSNKIKQFHGVLKNITTASSQKQIVVLFQENNKETQRPLDDTTISDMLDYSLDVIFKTKLSGEFVYINQACSLAGYTPEEMIGTKWMTYVPKKELPRYLTKVKQLISGKKITDFQTFIIHKNGQLIPVEFSGYVVKNKKKSFIIGVMRDLTNRIESNKLLEKYNEKLKKEITSKSEEITQKNETLAQCMEQYKCLFDEAAEAIAIAQDDVLAMVNPAFENIFGYTKEEVLTKPFTEFIHPDDRKKVYERYQKRLTGNLVKTGYQFRVIHKSNKVRWIEIHSAHVTWKNKPATLNFLIDITDKKEIENKFYRLFNNNPDGITEIDIKTGEILAINNVMAQRFEHTKEEMIRKNFKDYLSKDLYKKRINIAKNAIKNDTIVETYDARNKLEFNDTYVPIHYPTGKITILVISKDITEEKRKDRLLQKSEEKYRLLAQNSADLIYTMNIETKKFTYISPAVKKLLGYSLKEAYKLKPKDILTDESYSYQIEHLNSAGKKRKSQTDTINLQVKHKDGHVISVEVHSSFILNKKGDPIEILGIVRDISDRIAIEEKLKQSEHKFREIFNSSTDAIFIHDPKTMKIIDVNKETCRRFGYSKKEIKNKTIDDLSKGMHFAVGNTENQILHQRVLNGETIKKEWLSKTKKGELIWHEMFAKLIEIDGVPRFLAIARDIRERKKAEEQLKRYSQNLEEDVKNKTKELQQTLEQLKNSETKYRTLFQKAPVGIGIIDQNRNILEINKAMEEMTGYKQEKGKKLTIDFNAHYYNKKDSSIIRNKLLKSKNISDYELLLKKKNGEIYPALLNVESITLDGKPYWLTIERDITEIKNKEKQIKKTHTYLEKTINSASECIFAINNQYQLTLCNQAYKELIKTKKKNLYHRSIEPFIENISVIKDAIKQINKGAKTVNDTITILSKDAEKRLLSFSVTGIGSDGQNPEGFLFIGKDVTLDASRFGKLKEGTGYLIVDPSEKKIIDIVAFLQIKGYRGSILTRKQSGYSKQKMFTDHLTINFYAELALTEEPSLHFLQHQLNIIKKQVTSHKHTFIVLDRIDYLMTHFQFDFIMKWFYEVSNIISTHQAILFIHVPEGIMNPKQFAYLSAEFSLLPDQKIDQIALEQSYYDILLFIKQEQDNNVLVSYHHVGKHFNISKVTTKKRLDELEEKGLIGIKEKGRMKLLSVTAKAETLLNKRELL